MWNKLLRIFSATPAPTVATGATRPAAKEPPVAEPAKPVPAGIPIYPPIDQGVAFGGADAVLLTQAELLRRLRILLGVPPDEYERLYVSVLKSLASYIDLLPASQEGTHMGAGGLFRLALELAFYSRQASEGVLFAGRAGVEKRRELEPRWRYATFLAGLCCELYRPLSRMLVLTADGRQWPVHRMGLSEWLSASKEARYFIRWEKEGEHFEGGSATFLATRVIPQESLQYLQEGHPSIIPAMLDAIVADPQKSRNNQIAEVLHRMRTKVYERDQVLAPQHYGKLTVGVQLEPHLIDAMRQLVVNGTWAINVKKARVWYGKDGMFIVWRTAAKEMLEVLERQSVAGMPRDGATIAEVLERAGVLLCDKHDDLYWKIRTPMSENELVAVKLANPEVLLVAIEDDKPTPLDVTLDVKGGVAPVVTSPPAGASKSEPKAASPVPVPPEPTMPLAAESSQPEVRPDQVPPPMDEPPPPELPPDLDVSSRDIERHEEKSPPRQAKAKLPRNDDGPGAIQPVAETEVPGIPADMAARVSRATNTVLSLVVADQKAGLLQGCSITTADGWGVALEKLATYGVDASKVMIELQTLGWLHINPETPKRKIHSLEINGKAIHVAVIKRQVAEDLGIKL